MAEARVKKIISLLRKEYPDAKCSLIYETPFQLVAATILSAQCTDERVNKVTPVLFKKFPDAAAMSKATLLQLEAIIRSTGFFKNKAKSLLAMSQALVEEYAGKVPETMAELNGLRGVGRKTANVVLGNAFNRPDGVVVDTHVGRISRRMAFSSQTDPEKVEKDLNALIPKKDWVIFPHLLIDHGRAICTARRAFCEDCPVSSYCPKVGV